MFKYSGQNSDSDYSAVVLEVQKMNLEFLLDRNDDILARRQRFQCVFS